MSLLPSATVATIAAHAGAQVTLAGWVYHKTEKGKLIFVQLRDGSGTIQCVVFKKNVSDATFAQAQALAQEASCRVTGTIEENPGDQALEIRIADPRALQIFPPSTP